MTRSLRRLIILVAGVALPMVLDLTECGAAERRVFAEFPHYGGVRLQPSGNADAGSCMGHLPGPASEERVLAYYRQALRARGWTLPSLQASTGSDVQDRRFGSDELAVRRGNDTYTVLYESGPAL